MDGGAWWATVHGVTKSRTWLGDFTFTFHFHALEKEMATHSNVLAWRIPGTGEPGGLPSMGSHRVGYDWSYLAAAEAQHIWNLSSHFPALEPDHNLIYLGPWSSGKRCTLAAALKGLYVNVYPLSSRDKVLFHWHYSPCQGFLVNSSGPHLAGKGISLPLPKKWAVHNAML